MGCDGGTIPRRDELVRLKKKAETKDKDAEREFRWLHCALTQQRLQEPIVMCGLGRLYSKQSVIEQLLEKDKMPESCKHIRGIRDIKDLNLTPNPAFKDENKTGGSLDTRGVPYICKLMGIEMSGKFRFNALWSCGCVFSERAMKQIKTKNCPICQVPYNIEDVIVLNGCEEDIEMMQAKIEMRSSRKKAAKKSKNKPETVTSSAPPMPSVSSSTEVTTSNEVTTAEKPVAEKTKLISNKRMMNGKSLEDPEIKRLKEDYSVAKDPKASNVYKSLFTTHKSEQEQNRAHWVTYNPFYN